jgi:tetrahydromethanopterin S-methyltransferase subunit E
VLTSGEWALVLVAAIVVGFVVMVGLLVLLDWIVERFSRNEWD